MITGKTRMMSGLLAVLMVVSLLGAFVLPVTAEPEPQPQTVPAALLDDVVSATGLKDVSSLPDIVGYEEGPTQTEFKITDAAGLKQLRDLVYKGVNLSGVTIYQANDIDMAWEPFSGIGMIGGGSFNGNYDGNGFVIKNLYVVKNSPFNTNDEVTGGNGGAGLFGNVNGGTIKNVGIASGLIVGNRWTGAVVGSAESEAAIINCWNAATVVGGYDGTAGVVGRVAGGGSKVVNCYNLGTVIVSSSKSAGIVGWINDPHTYVANCYNAGEIVSGFKKVEKNEELHEYSVILNANFTLERGTKNANNYYVKDRGKTGSVAELYATAEENSTNPTIPAGYGNFTGKRIRTNDQAAGVTADDLKDTGTTGVAAKLNAQTDLLATGDGTDYTVTFAVPTDGAYPVLTYMNNEGTIIVQRSARTTINVNGDTSWRSDSGLYNLLFANRNGGFGDKVAAGEAHPMDNVTINSANDLFILTLVSNCGSYNEYYGNGNINITADIDMDDMSLLPGLQHYTSIADGIDGSWHGTLDGHNHVIKNWRVYAAIDGGNACAGLISAADGGDSVIRDLGMVNFRYSYETIYNDPAAYAYTYSAGIIERVYDITMEIDNCFATGVFNDSNIEYTIVQNNLGGILGRSWDGVIKVTNCWSNCRVTSSEGSDSARVIGSNMGGDISGTGNNYYFANYVMNDNNNPIADYEDYQMIVPDYEVNPINLYMVAYYLNQKLSTDGSGTPNHWTVHTDEKGDKYVTWGEATNATHKITVQKYLPDATLWPMDIEIYLNARDTIPTPSGIDGCTLRGSDYEPGGTMPQEDIKLIYDVNEGALNLYLVEQIAAEFDKYNINFFAETDKTINTKAKTAVKNYKGATLEGEALTEAIAEVNQIAADFAKAWPLELDPNLEYPHYPRYNEYRLYEALNTKKNWAIYNRRDWVAAVDHSDKSFEGVTLHLTNNIDILNNEIDPLCMDTPFNGTLDGHGYVFKNILINATVSNRPIGLIAEVAVSGIVQNLGIESGLINAVYTNTADGVGIGALAGAAAGASAIGEGAKFINCWNGADVMVTVGTTNNTNYSVSGLVGRGNLGTMIDGCYNIGNISGDMHASGLNDWGQTGALTYNSFNAGKVSAQNNTTTGLVRYNNVGSDVFSNSYSLYTNNVVNGGNDSLNSVNNTCLLSDDAYSTGELAWKLNSGYDESKGQRTYYTVENGKTVFGTAENQTVRISLDCDGNTQYVYANRGDTVELSYTLGDATYALAEGSSATLEGSTLSDFTGDVTVNVTLNGTNYTALEDKIKAVEAKNASLYQTEDGTPLEEYLTKLKSQIGDGTANAEEAFAVLNDISLKEGVLPAAHEAAENRDAAGYKIYNLADMEYVAMNAAVFDGKTLYFENDIVVEPASPANSWWYVTAAIDGQGHTVSGVTKREAWIHEATTIRNITFTDFTINSNENSGGIISQRVTNVNDKKTIFENVNLLDSSNTKVFNSGKNDAQNGHGGLLGKVEEDDTAVFTNVLIEGVTLTYNLGISGKGNVGLLVGPANGSMTAQNIIVRNNTLNVGSCNWGVSYLAAEMTNGTYNLDHIGIFGNTLTAGSLSGMLAGPVKNAATLTADNIIIAGNGREADSASYLDNASGNDTPVTSVDVTNLFTTRNETDRTEEKIEVDATQISDADARNGKTAYEANHNDANSNFDGELPTTKWWVINTDQAYPELGLEEDQPYKISFKTTDDESNQGRILDKTYYTNANGIMIGSDVQATINYAEPWSPYPPEVTTSFTTNTDFTYDFKIGADFLGASLTLGGEIGVNYYVHLYNNVEDSETAYMQFTFDDETQTVYRKDLVALTAETAPKEITIPTEGAVYVFTCRVNSLQMANDISAQFIVDTDTASRVVTYSVRDYGETVLGSSASDEAKDLVIALLNYGSSVQTRNNDRTDDLPNKNLTDAQKVLAEVSISETDFVQRKTGFVTGLIIKSSTLMMDSYTSIRHYFKLEEGGDIANYTFALVASDSSETPLTASPTEGWGGWYYIETSGLSSQQLDKMLTVKVRNTSTHEEMTIRYGPMTHVKNKLKNAKLYSEAEINIMKAMYWYYAETIDYVKSLQQA